MTLELDHVVISVRDLSNAVKQFENLGFYVHSGGDHGPTHNALIPFHNGAYIELISVKTRLTLNFIRMSNKLGFSNWQLHSKNNVMGRIMRWFSQPFGPVDWCIRAEIESNGATSYLSKNATFEREFHRKPPNKPMLRWTLAAPKNLALPLFIQDITARNERSPNFHKTIHENTAYAIKEILLPPKTLNVIATHMNKPAKNLQLGSIALSPSTTEQFPRFGVIISYAGKSDKTITAEQALGLPIWLTPIRP